MSVCVRAHGLMTVLSAESGTQEGISRHCISKNQPLEIESRLLLMRRVPLVCADVCGIGLGLTPHTCFLRHAP